MVYAWKITRDRFAEKCEDEPGDVGVMGPRDADTSLLDGKTERFSLWDDDGNCIYEGIIGGEYDGFEPLDDCGTPNFGCTAIKINGEWV